MLDFHFSAIVLKSKKNRNLIICLQPFLISLFLFVRVRAHVCVCNCPRLLFHLIQRCISSQSNPELENMAGLVSRLALGSHPSSEATPTQHFRGFVDLPFSPAPTWLML